MKTLLHSNKLSLTTNKFLIIMVAYKELLVQRSLLRFFSLCILPQMVPSRDFFFSSGVLRVFLSLLFGLVGSRVRVFLFPLPSFDLDFFTLVTSCSSNSKMTLKSEGQAVFLILSRSVRPNSIWFPSKK